MPERPTREDRIDVEALRSFDAKHRSFDPPKHPPLRDPNGNPYGVRHT